MSKRATHFDHAGANLWSSYESVAVAPLIDRATPQRVNAAFVLSIESAVEPRSREQRVLKSDRENYHDKRTGST